MTPPRARSLVVAAAWSLTLTACPGAIVPSSTATTQSRDVTAFRRIAIGSAFTAHATPGARSLSLRVSDNLLSHVQTFVDGDTLHVQLEPMTTVLGTGILEATITNDVLEGIDASGAAKVTASATPTTDFPLISSGASHVTLDSLSSTSLTVEASGSSDATVTGTASTGTATASGSSNLTLTGVPLQQLKVDASGASDIRARVSSSLTGSASGASTVTITGTPSNQVQVSGASTVTLGAP